MSEKEVVGYWLLVVRWPALHSLGEVGLTARWTGLFIKNNDI